MDRHVELIIEDIDLGQANIIKTWRLLIDQNLRTMVDYNYNKCNFRLQRIVKFYVLIMSTGFSKTNLNIFWLHAIVQLSTDHDLYTNICKQITKQLPTYFVDFQTFWAYLWSTDLVVIILVRNKMAWRYTLHRVYHLFHSTRSLYWCTHCFFTMKTPSCISAITGSRS